MSNYVLMYVCMYAWKNRKMAYAPAQAIDSIKLKQGYIRTKFYHPAISGTTTCGGCNKPSQLNLIPKFKLYLSNRFPHQTTAASHNIATRAKRSFKWFRCFIIPWSWTSRMVSIYLLFLSFSAEAHAISSLSSDYACEHVERYYSDVAHLRGEKLKQKLSSLVSKHQTLSYKKVWDALKVLDAADIDNPEASPEVVEIYSLRVVPKGLAGKPEGWNREHLWPQSYGLLSGQSLTDLHNLRPADVNVNSSRGNKFYGECSAKPSHCLRPANKESAADTETTKDRWAPPMKVRGDIARAILYMAVCYSFYGSSDGLNLRISDTPNIAKREMGMLSTLLKWNEMDPPSREEKLRNERICTKYQHNRNPFVDHPELANLIWRTKD